MSHQPQPMSQEDKLDEALKETFPASDAFWLEPQPAIDEIEDSGTPG